MNITSSIDPRDINPYPWWDRRSPFYVGDVPNPPTVYNPYPYWNTKAPEGYRYGGWNRPTTGDSTTQFIHVEPDFIHPEWEMTTTGTTDNKITYYDLSGKNVTPKEKRVAIEKENGVLVTLTNEISEFPLGVALSVAGTYALVGWWLEEDEDLDNALSSILYGETVNDALVHEYVHRVPTYGTLAFKKIVVVVDMEEDD